MSNFFYRKTMYSISILICLIVLFLRFFFIDKELGFFGDETLTILAASNFLLNGIYGHALGSVEPLFAKTVSSGFLTTLSAGIGFLIFGDIFSARLFFYFSNFFSFLLLCFLYLKYFTNKAFDITHLYFFSALYLSIIFFVPYSKATSVYPLGEFPGFILLLLSFLVLIKKPNIGAFLLGMIVWHAKFIYLPYALLGIFCSVSFKPFRLKDAIQNWFIRYFLFVLPVFLFLFYILAHSGKAELFHFLKHQESLKIEIFKVYSDDSDNSKKPIEVSTLAAHPEDLLGKLKFRLTSSEFEWKSYHITDKVKILLFGVFPLFLLLYLFFYELKKNQYKLNNKSLFLCGIFLIQLAFAYWYFLFHFKMWVRHYQPALFIGYFICGYFFYFTIFNQLNIKIRKWFLIIFCIFLFSNEIRRLKPYLYDDSDIYNMNTYSKSCSFKSPRKITYQEMLQHCFETPGDFINFIERSTIEH